MIPFIILAEKKKHMKSVFLFSVLITTVTQLLLALLHLYWVSFCFFMFAYFVAFNILEASLPSLISKQANSNSKGTAMGIYSTGQFLGIFAGGSLAGIIYQWSGNQGIFIANAIVGSIWFIVACYMKTNTYLSSVVLNFTFQPEDKDKVINALLQISGVQEVAFLKEKNILHLRVNDEIYRSGSAEHTLNKLSPHNP